MADRIELDAIRRDRGRLVSALTEAGATFRGKACRCPFHDDKNPSAGVHELDDGTWRFTCRACGWNDGKGTGDIFDVVRRHAGCDFKAALERLGLRNGHLNGSASSNGCAKPLKGSPQNRAIERNGSGATDDTPAHESEAQAPDYEHLWQTRGIDEVTARRFGLGMVGEPGARYWTFPITDGVTKGHAADGQEKKCWWSKGATSSHAWPVSLDGPGPVWVCPGELKALAVIACGLPAIGITSGEGNEKTPTDLPPAALERLRGRAAAFPPDDDPVGAAWGEHGGKQATDVCTEARIVRLPLSKADGMKDVGDYVLDLIQSGKAPDEIAATLSRFYELAPVVADCWTGTRIGDLWKSGKLWTPATFIRTGLKHLDARTCGGLRTRGVHAFCGKTGSAKSQLAVTIAQNTARVGTPVGFFSLELGKDEIAQLVAAQLSAIPRLKLATGNLNNLDAAALQKAMTEYGNKPLTILDDEHWPQGLTRDLFSSLVAKGVKRFGWRMVVLDYLNLIVPESDDRDQYTTDLRNSTMLKSLSRKHDIALLVVAAVRKGATKRESGNIGIDDLLGAGRLAYDATNVFLVSREQGQNDCGIVKVKPLKMRFAPCDESATDVQFRWRPRSGAIVDLDYEETDPATDDYDPDEERRIMEDIANEDEEGGAF